MDLSIIHGGERESVSRTGDPSHLGGTLEKMAKAREKWGGRWEPVHPSKNNPDDEKFVRKERGKGRKIIKVHYVIHS